ncbi:hypothetical protein JCM10295v2_005377 [Rhodotorula toruloides]
MASHKWSRPKALPVGVTTSLSLEQQQILAAVPRWKKAWVRPSTLKPGQNPNFKILKWVIDTDQDKSEGTEEEMQAALQEVAAGNIPLPGSSGGINADGTITLDFGGDGPSIPASGTATPALPPAAPPLVAPVPASTLQASSNPIALVQHANPAKPATGPAPSGAEPGVKDAVKGLEDVDMKDVTTDQGPAVGRDERSLVQEDQTAVQP